MLPHVTHMCHFTIDGWKREDKKAKPLAFGTGSETLVSLSLSLSHKWLTYRPRNITPLPFAFFPAHWTFLYSLQSRITTEEGWCVFPSTTDAHAGADLSPLGSPLKPWTNGKKRDTPSTKVAETQVCWAYLKDDSFLNPVEANTEGDVWLLSTIEGQGL